MRRISYWWHVAIALGSAILWGLSASYGLWWGATLCLILALMNTAAATLAVTRLEVEDFVEWRDAAKRASKGDG